MACSDRPLSDDGETSTTGDGDGDGTGSEESSTTTGDGDGDACDCPVGQLCVGVCVFADFSGYVIGGERCVDADVCEQFGLDSPECLEHACISLYAATPDCVDPTYPIICDESYVTPCDETVEGECPVGEKCVPLIPDAWGLWPSNCLAVVGSDPIGSACTSQGHEPAAIGADSCDASGVCWNETLTEGLFEGICRPFCSESEPQCPDGMSCQFVADEYQLCMPT